MPRCSSTCTPHMSNTRQISSKIQGPALFAVFAIIASLSMLQCVLGQDCTPTDTQSSVIHATSTLLPVTLYGFDQKTNPGFGQSFKKFRT